MAKPNYDYLEEERKKLWVKILQLEDLLNKRIDDEILKTASESASVAKQAQRKTTEYKNKSEELKVSIGEYQVEAKKNVDEIKDSKELLLENLHASQEILGQIQSCETHSTEIEKSLKESQESAKSNVESLEELFADYEEMEEKIGKLNDIVTTADDTSTKIDTLHKNLLAKKKDIDQVYSDIFGYTEDETTGVNVEGLKDQLDTAYIELTEDIANAKTGIKTFVEKTERDVKNLNDAAAKNFKGSLDYWEVQHETINEKIESLLPNALTAGLSSAFSEKKNAEIEDYRSLNITFNRAIFVLIFVSLLPLAVSVYSLETNRTFQTVVNDLPRLVLAFLPLYVPVLWVAYSANRKMNLSKRLSEEYSHKEVLSKTFEGLSKQIEGITDDHTSTDLKNKLLYNLLEASSENPGKLISDYNKADHPLMDALDKSVKLATAVEKLERLPGFKKLSQRWGNENKQNLAAENQKANSGLGDLKDEEE